MGQMTHPPPMSLSGMPSSHLATKSPRYPPQFLPVALLLLLLIFGIPETMGETELYEADWHEMGYGELVMQGRRDILSGILCQNYPIQWNTELRTTELGTKINSDQQSSGILRKVIYNNVHLIIGPEKSRHFVPSNGCKLVRGSKFHCSRENYLSAGRVSY